MRGDQRVGIHPVGVLSGQSSKIFEIGSAPHEVGSTKQKKIDVRSSTAGLRANEIPCGPSFILRETLDPIHDTSTAHYRYPLFKATVRSFYV